MLRSTITDDDDPPVLTIADASVSEGGKVQFAVALDAVSGRAVTVEWTTGDDGADGANQATANIDYTAQTTAQTLTISAGSASGTIGVQTTGDSVAEGDETFAVTLASPTNATLGTPATATGTITDDDVAPSKASLSLSPNSVGEGAEAATVTVTATLAGSVTFDADTTVSVKVGKDGDAAESGTDYTGVEGFDVTITAGQRSGLGTFSLAPIQDVLDEDDEKLTVHATASGLSVSDAEVAIVDDDVVPVVSVGVVSVVEGDSGSVNLVFKVSIGSVSGRDVVVPYTVAGTATAGEDYTAPEGASVTIPAGSTSVSVTFVVTGDRVDESDETIILTPGTPTNAKVPTDGSGAVTGTITDDDDRGVTLSSSAGVAVPAGGLTVHEVDKPATEDVQENVATYEVSLVSAPTGTVTISVASDDATVATVSPRTLTFAPSDWSARSVTVTAVDDDVDNTGDQRKTTITHMVTSSGNDYDDESVGSVAVTVTDDEATPTATLSLAPAVIDESGATNESTVTAMLSGKSDSAVTVEVSVPNGSPVTLSTNKTLTIAAGAMTSTGAVTLTAVDNDVDAPNAAVSVSGAASGGGVADPSDVTLTITDDEDTPMTASLSVSPTSVGEEDGATTVTVTASLSGSVTFDADTTVSVKVGKQGDSAISGTDYRAVSDVMLTITAGASSGEKTFTLTPTDDALDEDDEKLTVFATAAGLTVSDAEVMITDDDALPELTVADASVAEGGKAQFTVTLTPVSGRDVSVQWTTGDDGADGANQATADSDYTAQSTAATLTITAGSASGTVEVQTTEDSVAEGAETFAVTLASPTNATLGTPAMATGTITDDDAAPSTASLSVSPTSVAEGAEATTVTVTATLAGSVTFDADKTVSVKVGKSGDAAESGTDYTAVSDVTLTITAGESSGQQTFSLAPTVDALDEDDEKLTVHATASGLTVSDAEVAITDDDALPVLTIADVSVAEGGKAQFKVTLTPVSGRDVTVQWTTGDDGAQGANQATADVDYTAQGTAASLTIAAGSASGTIEVQTTGDSVDEGDETFAVTLASPTNATLGTPATATGTITDDDERGVTLSSSTGVGVPAGGLTVHEVDKSATEDVQENVATYEVSLASAPTGTVTISVTSADATVATVSPQTLTFTPSDWDALTVTVTAVDDDVDNTGDQRKTTITHMVTSSGNDYDDESVGSVAVTVTDDEDTPTAALSLDPATIDESGDDNVSTVSAVLSGKSDTAVTVEVSVPNGSPVTLSTTKTLTFSAGSMTSTGTVTLTAVDNDVDAANATVAVSGAASGGGVSSPSDVALTITDDEDTPTVTLSLAPAVIDESGDDNESAVTASLSGKSDSAVTVEVSVPNGSPVTLSTNTTLTIAAGATTSTGTVTLTAVDNDVHAANATVTVSGTATGGGVADPSDVTLTITDDDAAPSTVSLSVSPTSVGEEDGATTVTVTASLSGSVTFDADTTVTVKVGMQGDSAISGTDYRAVSDVMLTITAGASSGEKTFTLTPTDDALDEDDESLTVHATATGLTVSEAEVTITDDDDPPELTIADASVTEGGEAQFTVTLTPVSGRDVSVQWTTGDDGADGANQATAGSDYTAQTTAATLTIAAGSATGTIGVQTTEDSVDESDETFTVTLASPTNATLGTPATATGTITDDDERGVTLSSSTGVGVPAGGLTVHEVDKPATEDVQENVATYEVSLASAPTGTVTISVTSADATVATVSPQTLTFTPSDWDALTVTVTAVDDDVDNTGDQRKTTITHMVTSSGNDYDDESIGSVAVTVTDDEDTPSVTLSLSPATINESGATNKSTVSAMLSGKSDSAVTVEVSVPNGSPVTLSADTTLTVAAGAMTSTGTVTLTAVDNDVDAANATVTVSGVASGGGVADPSDVTLTVTDDEDTPTVTLSLDPAVIDESGDDNVSTVSASLSGKSDSAVAVEVSVPNGSPVTLSADTTLTVAAGAMTSTGTVTLTAVDNDVDAPNATVTVSGTASGGGVANPSDVTLTITDDDEAPSTASLSVSPTSVAEGAEATTVTVTAILAGSVTFDADKTVTVKVGKQGDAAVSGTDYTAVSDVMLTITAGESSGEKTFSLAPIQDALDEDDEKLTVHATATGLTVSDAEVTITDDDALPELTIADASVAEGGKAQFTVTLTPVSGRDVTVQWTTGDDGAEGANQATADTDYTAQSTAASLTIAAGSASGTIGVQTTDDSVDEGDETFTVTLASPTNATLGSAKTATGTITDDDERGVTLSSSTGVAVPAGGLTAHEVDKSATEDVQENVATYEVSLASAPTGTVTITVASADTTVATVIPNTLTFTPSDWDALTVTVTAVDDDVDNTGDQRKTTITHMVTSSGNDYDDESISSVAVTVTDDEDTPTATLSLSPATINESGATNKSTVTAMLSGKSDTAVTVEVSVPNGSPVTLSANKTLTIAAGATTSAGAVTLTAVDNDVDAANAAVSVSGTASGGGVADPSDVTLTITDDDEAPSTVALSVSPSSVGEGAGATTVTVTATLAGSVTFDADKTVTVKVGKQR